MANIGSPVTVFYAVQYDWPQQATGVGQIALWPSPCIPESLNGSDEFHTHMIDPGCIIKRCQPTNLPSSRKPPPLLPSSSRNRQLSRASRTDSELLIISRWVNRRRPAPTQMRTSSHSHFRCDSRSARLANFSPVPFRPPEYVVNTNFLFVMLAPCINSANMRHPPLPLYRHIPRLLTRNWKQQTMQLLVSSIVRSFSISFCHLSHHDQLPRR